MSERKDNFEELQRRKKRKLNSNQKDRKNVKRRGRAKPHRFGLTLVTIQAIVSMLFVGMLQIMGILPMKYMIAIAAVLTLLFGITLATQMKRKKKAIFGKLLSMLLIVAISFSTFYVAKMNGALNKMTGGKYKIDNMVVAVLKDDKAESIKDAKEYEYGVQFKMGASDVQAAVQMISDEVGAEILTEAYKDLQQQAQALLDEEVDAIIYNEGYTKTIEEAIPGFQNKVKIIYEHKIKKELTSLQVDANVMEPFNIYISGIDLYGEIGQTSRSDVNIIGVVNPESHQVLLITTPRDYYVPIPGVTRGQRDKLTHAGNYGVDVSMATLEQLYDIEIPFFVRVNFTSAIDVVDQMGGVDVKSEYAFTTGPETNTTLHVKKGMNHFNGKEALAFSRERHTVPGGDNQRGKNQQAVITAMIQKMVSPQMLVKASGIIDSVSNNVETNMSNEQIQSLIKMQLNKGGGWHIYSVAAEGTNAKETCYTASSAGPLFVVNPSEESIESVKEMIERVQNGEIIEGSEIAE